MKALIANRSLVSRAIFLGTKKTFGIGAEFQEVPRPVILDKEILVQVRAVALNPIDHMCIDLLAPNSSRIGCDFAGNVVEVGKSAEGNWKVGDRIAGLVHGGLSPEKGSFAEYLKTDGDLVWRIPDGIADEVAATYGISATTASFVLNTHLDVPVPNATQTRSVGTTQKTILIYAGSTAVGLFAIQLAKMAGYQVVTTTSPHSFELVQSYGADHAFDYRSPTAIEDITTQFPHISQAFDCISKGPSTEFCAQVMKKEGGKVITLLNTGKPKVPKVNVKSVLIFTAFGEAFTWLPPVGPKFLANPSDRAALVRFYAALPGLIQNLKAPPISLVEGGLGGVLKGLDELRRGKVSGKKLVVKI